MSIPPNPDRDRQRVNRMIEGGMTFGQVENAIDRFDLPDEHKSALWLLAWSRLDPHGQERIAEDAWVGAVSSSERPMHRVSLGKRRRALQALPEPSRPRSR